MGSTLPPVRARPLHHNRGRNPAPRPKLPFHFRPHWLRPLHHVLQNLVYDVLLEDSKITVGLQILLQRLQLQTALVRHVTDGQYAKVGKPGLRAHRRELRVIDHNLVPRKLVGPRLNLGELRVETREGVLSRITRRFTHATIVAFARRRTRRHAPRIKPDTVLGASLRVLSSPEW